MSSPRNDEQVHFYSPLVSFLSLPLPPCKTLLIGPSLKPYRIPIAALTNASPVFEAMLQGPYIESTTEHCEINLSDDNPDAFEKVLMLIPDYPQKLQFEYLFGESLNELIVVWTLAHKYAFQNVCDLIMDYAATAPSAAIRNGGVVEVNTHLRPAVVWTDRALQDIANTYTLVNSQNYISVVEEFHTDLATFESSSLRRLSSMMAKRVLDMNLNQNRLIQQYPAASYAQTTNPNSRNYVYSATATPIVATENIMY